MAAANAGVEGGTAAEDVGAKAVLKRYEGLVAVRSKAVKGKGAWYWTHLEPVLVHHADSGLPKAVKLRCSLCDSIFSASNPSRTASEHLKRGTCPNFSSPSAAAKALPSSASPSRKRPTSATATPSPTYQIPPLAVVDPARFCSAYPVAAAATPSPSHQQLVLSGGKEDLGALAMLEDSVKRLKSPKTSPGPARCRAQVDSALGLLADWLYESWGAVSVSSVADHPQFRDFLQQVGLPPLARRDLLGPRLDARFGDARADAEAKIRDALFFQLASHGWKKPSATAATDCLVTLTVNLPNGTSVFRCAVLAGNRAASKYAEEVFWEAVVNTAGAVAAEKCVGIVADRFKAKALRNLENQNQWMVNLCCQLQGFNSLIKDFSRELPLFKSASTNCSKLANLFNSNSQARRVFHKYQLQELDHTALLVLPPDNGGSLTVGFSPVFKMVEDILAAARPLQLAVMDESYKIVSMEDPDAREAGEMISNMEFWTELEAVGALMKLVGAMAQEIEAERPLVGQCLPLWEELRSKVKDWCIKFNIAGNHLEKIIDRRFKRNYHPAWSAAFILDPLYLIRDISGKYLPPFKCLTPEQEKDVDKLITRLVSKEEAHIALMELMKWRSEGLDPLYAQAVQMKEKDPATGKMKVANPQSSRLVWETCLSEFKCLGKVAVRLIFMHATSCGFKCNWSFLRWVSAHRHSRVGMDRAQKMMFIAANAKLERRDFSSEEEKDVELFADCENSDVLNEVFVDAPSI